VVLPCHDYLNVFNFITPDFIDSATLKGRNVSYILTNNVYGDTKEKIIIKKTINSNTILGNTWLSPLERSKDGYTYLDNNKIISRYYTSKAVNEVNIGSQINENFDRHSIVNEGDSVYYYATAVYGRKKKLYSKDTSIVDFDFYRWYKPNNTTKFLFSASTLVPDSMLVPELFEGGGIYGNLLDMYHWNWLQKNGTNKLLINFAFAGFYQIDLTTAHIDWAWSHTGRTFSKVNGKGDLSSPYYTHDVNLVKSGPFKGCYSYFENGSLGDSILPFKPARARIFKINPDNSVEIVFEKIFDISPKALGSVDVVDDFVLVNLGLELPLGDIMEINDTKGTKAAMDFLKHYSHPNVYLFDSKGNEISSYSYPFGFYSYSAWIKKKF
jgi:hypothetical protein